MSAQIIDGKAVAAAVKEDNLKRIAMLKENYGVVPGLAVILVGEDPASQVYVASKVKMCAELGMESRKYALPAETTQEELLKLIGELNEDPAIHGILVQSPPPRHIDEGAVIEAINPDKDVDCFSERNVGRVLIGGKPGFVPCTPAGVMELLKSYGVDCSGKHAVVVGRSNIVGKPLAALLMQKAAGANATVTVVHSGTPDIGVFTRQADILIAAVGKPEFIKADMVKEGAVVVDVGINRIPDASRKSGNRLVGDVEYDSVAAKASMITPVPGGVGPMTIALLMRNTITACEFACGKK